MHSINGFLYDLAKIQTCLAQDLADEATMEISKLMTKLRDTRTSPGSLRLGAAKLLWHAQEAVLRQESEHWRMVAARAVWQTFVFIHGQRQALAAEGGTFDADANLE